MVSLISFNGVQNVFTFVRLKKIKIFPFNEKNLYICISYLSCIRMYFKRKRKKNKHKNPMNVKSTSARYMRKITERILSKKRLFMYVD